MAKNNDHESWVKAQADALYEDLCAREAAQAEAAQQQSVTVEGDQHGISGGTHHGDIHFHF